MRMMIHIQKSLAATPFFKRNWAIVFMTLAWCCWAGCSSENKVTNSDTPKEYEVGKNRYTTEVDGDTREYYVHVPAGYDANAATPVVFMLHGTTGDGERFYNISGWTEVGDAENILTVFPSSWQYCVIDNGRTFTTTKWHVYPGSFEYCAGERPRDDIKFLRQIIAELNQRFNVDSKRTYLAGFSNGGQMAGRCAVEMSDVFAAIAESAGTLPLDTTFTPMRKLPVIFQLGNSDDKWTLNASFDIPMALFDSLLTNNPVFQGIVQTHTSTFGLASTYTMTGDTSSVLAATFEAAPPNPALEFKFALIKDLEHNYPNGTNHALKGAELNWQWMKQFTLP